MVVQPTPAAVAGEDRVVVRSGRGLAGRRTSSKENSWWTSKEGRQQLVTDARTSAVVKHRTRRLSKELNEETEAEERAQFCAECKLM
mmetsp:Transcript_98531/g.263547  ORF Transcript_98531/g.263547 Transcript_98531/m.263547 type:complete len:87 (+) Transcript_98531:29-289(+)